MVNYQEELSQAWERAQKDIDLQDFFTGLKDGTYTDFKDYLEKTLEDPAGKNIIPQFIESVAPQISQYKEIQEASTEKPEKLFDKSYSDDVAENIRQYRTQPRDGGIGKPPEEPEEPEEPEPTKLPRGKIKEVIRRQSFFEDIEEDPDGILIRHISRSPNPVRRIQKQFNLSEEEATTALKEAIQNATPTTRKNILKNREQLLQDLGLDATAGGKAHSL